METPALAPPKKPEEHISKALNAGMGVGLTTSASLVLAFGIFFGNWLRKNSNNITETQEKAAKGFEWLVIGGKGGLIVVLIVLALINVHSTYVSENPRKFLQDAFATGGAGAIAAAFLTATRGRIDLWINHFVFALMLFFLYAVCREFAGYFTVFGNEEMTAKEMKQKSALSKPVLIITGIMALVAIGLAITARDVPDLSQGIFKNLSQSLGFALETIIFVAIITLGEIVVARNHGDPIGPAIGTSALLFTVAHLVLQGGGFYSHLYHPVPSCIR